MGMKARVSKFQSVIYDIITKGPHVILRWVTHRVAGTGYSRMHPHPLHPMGEVFTHQQTRGGKIPPNPHPNRVFTRG
jgi:hypothetical protein